MQRTGDFAYTTGANYPRLQIALGPTPPVELPDAASIASRSIPSSRRDSFSNQRFVGCSQRGGRHRRALSTGDRPAKADSRCSPELPPFALKRAARSSRTSGCRWTLALRAKSLGVATIEPKCSPIRDSNHACGQWGLVADNRSPRRDVRAIRNAASSARVQQESAGPISPA